MYFSIETVDIVVPQPSQSLIEAYDKWQNLAKAVVCCDFALRVAVTSWSDEVAKEMEVLVKDKGLCRFVSVYCG
jgi:dihydropyrimidinase